MGFTFTYMYVSIGQSLSTDFSVLYTYLHDDRYNDIAIQDLNE